jgi:hypothetical protein
MKMNQSGTGTERAETGEKEPKGVGKADRGSRPCGHMGKNDGRLGEHNDGNKGEREVYSHVRTPHEQDGY